MCVCVCVCEYKLDPYGNSGRYDPQHKVTQDIHTYRIIYIYIMCDYYI
jgi:hypothetical protein